MKLYEISERYRNLVELLEDESIDEEAVVAALEEVEGEFAEKALNIARILKNIEAQIMVLTSEMDRLAKLKKVFTNKHNRLKTYLEMQMLVSGIEKIADPVLPLALRIAPASVEVDPGAKVPEQYLIPQEPKIDKRGLLEALKAGEKIPGVRLIDDRKYLKIG